MMSDLISRNDAIEAIEFKKIYMTAYNSYVSEGNPLKQYNKGLDDAIKAVNSLAPAEVEQKKGKWENASINTYELSYGTTAYEPVYRCSACGGVTESYLRLDEPIMPEDADFPNFCPHCGADMREKYEDIPMEYFENEGI